MDTLTKAFLEWANGKGYDTAHAYNHNKGRWVFLSPMTADVYEAWQAAQSVPVVGEPVAYLKADADGNVLWSEDCVCEDAVWAGEDSEFVEYSLPVYQKPTNSIPATELASLRARLERAEDVLRTLASDLGAGGYNAESVDAEVFEHKIRNGVNMLLNPLINRLEQAEKERDALRKDAEWPDCGTCANRGRVNGLSQETFCGHCSWSEKWRKNHYKPTAIAGEKK